MLIVIDPMTKMEIADTLFIRGLEWRIAREKAAVLDM